MHKWSWVEWFMELSADMVANFTTIAIAWTAKSKVLKMIGDFIDSCRRQKIKDHKDAKQEH